MALGIIRLYQLFISPLLGPTCRFEPSCSHYSMAVLRSHGLLRGLWLSTVRVSKCHPFHPGGFDPVK
jgi:putative membrane protein insertion efficiency factor